MDTCVLCKLTYYEFIAIYIDKEEKALQYFRSHGVLPCEVKCLKCGSYCVLRTESNIWHCHSSFAVANEKRKRRPCGYSVSDTHGTFLQDIHIPAWKLLLFINQLIHYSWYNEIAEENLEISYRTSVIWRTFCSEVFEYWFENKPPIGGPDIEVEIGEFLISPSEGSERQELREARLFGGIERISKKLFIVPLKDGSLLSPQKEDSLLPLIKKFISTGSIVYSDLWKDYQGVHEQEYLLLSHNYSLKYIEMKDLLIHTQHIKRVWRDLKDYVQSSGLYSNTLHQYLARYMFVHSSNEHCELLHEFMQTAVDLYPHNGKRVRFFKCVEDEAEDKNTPEESDNDIISKLLSYSGSRSSISEEIGLSKGDYWGTIGVNEEKVLEDK